LNEIIKLKGITIFGFYGVSPAEREVGQKIQIDVELQADLTAACKSDSLQDTINYESVYARVVDAAASKKHRLLESLGEDIAYTLLKDFPISKVVVSLRKANLPFPNNLSHVEVVITREAEY